MLLNHNERSRTILENERKQSYIKANSGKRTLFAHEMKLFILKAFADNVAQMS